MPFVLHPYAAVKDGRVVRFIDSETAIGQGEIALPVVADADPVLGEDEKLWGPDFEVLGDKVRAYGRAMALGPEDLLQKRIVALDALIAANKAAV